tara:strand:- start:4816 stop:5007 length:192 start_codon:yes stop_codon:yes gene_type:complete
MKEKVKCPQCKILVEWKKENLFKPFCSKRCQLLDLGSWASERNKIAGSTLFDSEEDLEEITKH